VRHVPDVRHTVERQGVVFAQGEEGDRALDDLADPAVRTTAALGRERREFGVAS
jgi:hypothetical protein